MDDNKYGLIAASIVAVGLVVVAVAIATRPPQSSSVTVGGDTNPTPVVVSGNGNQPVPVGSQPDMFGGTTGLDSLYLKGNLTVDGTTVLAGYPSSTLSALSVTGFFGASSTFVVPNALTTLAQLSVTGTSALTGAVTLGSTLAVPSALTTLSTASVTGTLIIGTGGTALDGHFQRGLSIDPSAVAVGAPSSSAYALTGASVGDTCSVMSTAGDFLSTTSTMQVRCRITATNVATLFFNNVTTTGSFDAASSTFSIQAWSY